MRLKILAALALISAAASAPAEAAERWNIAASTCTAVQGQALMQVSGATVSFAAGKTGTIVLMCPITNSRGGVVNGADTIYTTGVISDMQVAYQSSTGQDESASVIAELIQTPMLTGVGASQSVFKSYGFAVTTYTRQSVPIANPFANRFDFGANVYHVQVTLKRSTISQAASVTAISITGRVLPV